MADKAQTIDEYLDGVEPAQRRELERIRSVVLQLVPEAIETMSYRMPTLKYRGKALVYFTASKKHLSFYPSSFAIEELRDELDGYETTEHAIKFTLEDPLPESLIERLVAAHKRIIDTAQ